MFPDLTRDDVFRLETRRLWLRWPRGADAAAMVRLAGDKAVADMTSSIPHPFAREDATASVLTSRRANADGEALTLAVTPRSKPGDLIGLASIFGRSPEATPEVAFWMGVPFWGQGFATEAVRALLDAFFAYAGGAEVASSCRVIDPGSRRVVEKCGFSYVGSGLQPFPARGGVLPVDQFRLDRRKWLSLKSWSASDYVPHGPVPTEAVSVH